MQSQPIDLPSAVTQPVFYVTNDVSRGVGLENLISDYHIICLDDHPLVSLLKKRGVSVFCLEQELGQKNTLIRSSSLILNHPLVLRFIKEKSKNKIPAVLFFKPQRKMEIIAEENGFNLIGNNSLLNRQFEDKVGFYNLAVKNNLPVPEGKIIELQKINFSDEEKSFGLPFVIQFDLGWAGNSTFFINKQKDLIDLQKKYGQKIVKLSRFITGITVLNNAVVLPRTILQSTPGVQIDSSLDLTRMRGGTGGRQWPVDLNSDQEETIKTITEKVGNIMRSFGYFGFFGLDFLVEENSGRIYLSENNARLTASASFYTQLQLQNNQFPLLAYHLLAFLRPDLLDKVEEESPFSVFGSEIIGRNTFELPVKITKSLPLGLYDLNLNFKQENIWLKENNNDIWLTSAGENRMVNSEIEMFKINSFDKVVDQKGKLLPQYDFLVKKIRQAITWEA